MHGKPQIVFKRDSKGELKYNMAKTAKEAVKQFKKLIKGIREEQEYGDEIVENIPMVDTTVEYTLINELTAEENGELEGELNPPESIDKSTRPQFLITQLDQIEDTLNKTIEEINNTDENEFNKKFELERRVFGLRKTRDLTADQIRKENVRELQEKDIKITTF